jgi:apolipoprotein N-acyltransferase
MSRAPRLAAAAASGAVLGASYIPGAWGALAWVALAPLFWLVQEAAPSEAAALGTVYGAVANAAGYPFGPLFLARFLGLGLAPGAAAFAAVCAWDGAARYGLCAGAAALAPRSWRPAALAAALVLTDRWAPTLGPQPLAMTQLFHLAGVQSAAPLGAAFVAGLLAAVNGALSWAARRRDARALAALAAALALAAGNEAWGRRVLARARAARARRPFTVALVQEPARPLGRASADEVDADQGVYSAQSARASAGGGLDLLVWPESSWAGRVSYGPGRASLSDGRALSAALAPAAAREPLLLNARATGPDGALRNVSILLDGRGGVAGVSEKRVLIPFGEFLPFESRLAPLRRLAPNIGHLVAGAAYEPMALGSVRVGVLICYENMRPGPAARLAAAGATLLVVQANDDFLDRPWGAEQHLEFSRLRAVETRRVVAHSAKTGVSAVVAATGEVLGRLEFGREGFLRRTVALDFPGTP